MSMNYITITYHQNFAHMLEATFTNLQACSNQIPPKRCITPIPGVVSRSFEIPWSVLVQVNPFMWIKHGLKPMANVPIQQDYSNFSILVNEISFGYLKSMNEFNWEKRICNNLTWKVDMKKNYIAIQWRDEQLRLTPDCLERYCITSPDKIILPLKTSPRCYRVAQQRKQWDTRLLNFANIGCDCLADTSTICLLFANSGALQLCLQILNDMFKLDCHTTLIEYSKATRQNVPLENILFDFWSNYAFTMLLSLGFRVEKELTTTTVRKIQQLSANSRGKPYSQHPCYLKLVAIYYRAKQDRFIDINTEFDKISPMASSTPLKNWEYVPRIYLTPYGVYPLSIKPMKGNRIIRQKKRFGPSENFCRVIIRDIDLRAPQTDFMSINEEWIKDLITERTSISIGNLLFQFLLCSNSQLRDKSFWFYAPYNGWNSERIRRWMGDFSHEKCVGARIARMALSLTGTTATIKLRNNQIEEIPDINDANGRSFTDGIGKISPEALRQALFVINPDLIEENHMPCLVQARINGNKGVFVVDPNLANRGILIQYRKSQHKFKVEHNVLEIVKHGASGPAFLNRQVITLLENMGVEKHIFLKLQNKVRTKISMSLLANTTAQRVLEQTIRLYDWERMHKSGVQMTQEPFARSLLLLIAQDRLRRLKEKSHVQISMSDGRMLIGTVDETNSLKYGQVFIQLRDLNGVKTVLKNCQVLVTKNPAHFPGDIRKLEAVDCPALHHLSECIVFPAQGERPHPNEISGSDLDGDEYWVCWNEELVHHAKIEYQPAVFDSAGKAKYEDEITMQVIADFIFEYLNSDQLGVLSNRHLACCATYSPNHEFSLKLAEIISEAVDFPKTGKLPKIPKNIKITKYPDYMENKTKESFVSESSIGEMYRQIKEVWTIHTSWQESVEDEPVKIDRNYLVNGYERYINEAKEEYEYYSSKVNLLVSIYNLQNEYELITGYHSGPEEEKKNNDSVETASLEFRNLNAEMRDRFNAEFLSHENKQCKASAWYYVAYRAGSILSFGWIMNRLMADIIKSKKLPQQDHQALKRIGESLLENNYAHIAQYLAGCFGIEIDEYQNLSKIEIMAANFLKIIEKCSESSSTQTHANNFLIFLHRIALRIV